MLSLRFPALPACNTGLTLFPSTPSPNKTSLRKNNATTLPKFGSKRKVVLATRALFGNKVEVGDLSGGEEQQLPEGLQLDLMPKHVALFADGHRRWGDQRGLPPIVSYTAGAQKFKEIAGLCYKWGIETVSVFAFHSTHWLRPQQDVDFTMGYFQREVKSYREAFVRLGVRVSVIGNRSSLPEHLQKLISEVEEATKSNTKLHIIAPLDYDGHYDITQACKKVIGNVKDGLLQPKDITASVIERELLTNVGAKYPHPDLFIRTGGKQRISNFMLWQLAYTELYFADKLWPEFEEADFVEALRSFQGRQRRYGGGSNSGDC